MRQLGKAIGIIATAMARENALHADVSAWGAPSECHGVVSRGEAKRLREARRHAKSVSGLSRRAFNKELNGVSARVIEDATTRIYEKICPHF